MLNKAQQALLSFHAQFSSQLHANPRLRWMLWGVAYILVLYVALSVHEWRQVGSDTIAQLQRTSSRLDQLQHQPQWPDRLKQEQQLSAQLRNRLWEAQSESLAEADVQNYLRKLMADHNLANYRPRLAPSERIEIAGEAVIKVTAEVSGSLAADQIDHLLKALADNPKFIAIERFGYASQRAGQLDMLVTVYFLVVEKPSTDAAADATVQPAQDGGTSVVR
jgi:hypothetical protein